MGNNAPHAAGRIAEEETGAPPAPRLPCAVMLRCALELPLTAAMQGYTAAQVIANGRMAWLLLVKTARMSAGGRSITMPTLTRRLLHAVRDEATLLLSMAGEYP